MADKNDKFLIGKVPPLDARIPKLIYRGTQYSQAVPNGTRTKVYRMGIDPANSAWLNATERNSISVHEFGFYRYILDVGGRSGTTWSALSNKLRLGSLVFKEESGYADWWHAGLVAGKHYVPVKSDLSDLYDQYVWAEANPKKVRRIAEAGRAYAVAARSQQSMDAHLRDVARRMSRPGPTCSPKLTLELN